MPSIVGAKETQIRLSGKEAAIPSGPIPAVSYYMNCLNSLLVNHSISKELIDYKKSKRLWSKKQDALVALALLFNPMDIINKLIIIDDDNALLPQGCSNKFCDLGEVTSVIAIASDTVVGGQQTTITKVMLCKTNWIIQYWISPMKEMQRRVARIAKKSLPETYEYFDAVELVLKLNRLSELVGRMQVQEQQTPPPPPETKHCRHCAGKGALCACKHGCARTALSECVDHPYVRCDSCQREGLRGARYKCQDCHDYDLCSNCYNSQDDPHIYCKFWLVEKHEGVEVSVDPRRAIVVEPVAIPVPVDPVPVKPIPIPVPVPAPLDPVPAPVPVPVPAAGGFVAGQKVRLTGLSDGESEGRMGMVERSIPGDKYLILLAGGEGGKKVCQSIHLEAVVEQHDDPKFPLNSCVETKGLMLDSDNGKYGVIVAYESTDQVSVKLFDDDRTITVQKSNLHVIDEVES